VRRWEAANSVCSRVWRWLCFHPCSSERVLFVCAFGCLLFLADFSGMKRDAFSLRLFCLDRQEGMFSDVIPLGLCRLKFVYCLSILFACSSGLCPSVYYCFRVLSLMGHLVSNIFTFYGSCWRIGAKSWFLIFTFSWFELHVESCNCFSELFPRSWKALSNHPGAFFSPLNLFFFP